MPDRYNDSVISNILRTLGLPKGGDAVEKRERFARHIETEHNDYLMAWEIRNRKSWEEMTAVEARELLAERPELKSNMGILSRLAKP